MTIALSNRAFDSTAFGVAKRKEAKSTLDLFLEAAAPSIVEHLHVPARAARYAPIPEEFDRGALSQWLGNMLNGGGLWHHQGLALEKVARDANVVVSTSTASGKTLIFQAAVMRALLQHNRRSLILYTQKSLVADQYKRWQPSPAAAPPTPHLVGEIHGDVSPREREAILERCPIIVATEDVVHAWLMRQVTTPAGRRFFASLSCLVIDEAHALEGVFGSNCSYLFRRLRAAARSCNDASSDQTPPLQIVAATATIAEPVEHLARLTGCEFETITDAENGAPFHGMDLLHIEGPHYGAPAEKMVADIIGNLASTIAPNAAIAFIDGRQSAERITQRVGRDDVQPYRSGFKHDERSMIEQRMRDGALRGVVSTSALELGIDVPGFTVGMTLGVPASRKALRQRLGRAGRTQPSVFAVIAPSTAFTQLGTSFREYAQGKVEQSPLYLDNRIIQYLNARCLMTEIADDGSVTTLPVGISWPDGFAEMFTSSQPGNPRPRDLDHIVLNGSDSPQGTFSLRNIGDDRYRLRMARNVDVEIGSIDLEKALREAFPGATYRHLKKAYRVVGWRSTPYERSILLNPIATGPETRPMRSTRVTVSHDANAIIGGRLRASDTGSLSELDMHVVESVEGYTIGGKSFPYRELRERDRAMQRRSREFSTTGVLIRIDEPWFSGDGEAPRAARKAVSEALVKMLAQERCIAGSELRTAHSQVYFSSAAGSTKIENAVAIFDGVSGGLRLTMPLFDEITAYLERFSKAVDLAGADALLSRTFVNRLIAWEASLRHQSAGHESQIKIDSEERLVLAPGSEVVFRLRGEVHHRRLVEPQLLWLGDEEQFGYRYETTPGVSAWIAHTCVEPIGGEWRHVIWNARSGEWREIEV